MTIKANRLLSVSKHHIAKNCVCCGSQNLSVSPAILMPFVAHRVFGWVPVAIDASWNMETINNGYAYSICNSLLCSECGLLFLDIRFTDYELNNLYTDYRGDEYCKLRNFYEPGYDSRNNLLNEGINYIQQVEGFIRPYINSPLFVLDWGGDTGKNTPFKTVAERVDIYDISEKNVLQGLNIVTQDEIISGNYNLVICSNVLEHVPYPADVLFQILKCMDKDTLLYIELPFEDLMLNGSSNLPYNKKHWHEHINFFSENSLRCLLDKMGLYVVDLKTIQVMNGDKISHLFQILCKHNSDL